MFGVFTIVYLSCIVLLYCSHGLNVLYWGEWLSEPVEGSKIWKEGAINNSRSFEWTDVGSNSTNIWVEWETIILLPSQFPPALLINWPCLYSQGLLRSSGSHNENKKVIKTIELRYVFKWRIWSHKASWWDSK